MQLSDKKINFTKAMKLAFVNDFGFLASKKAINYLEKEKKDRELIVGYYKNQIVVMHLIEFKNLKIQEITLKYNNILEKWEIKSWL